MMGFHRPEAEELAAAIGTAFSTKDLIRISLADARQEAVHPLD
jgi:hypothetical protein